MENPVALTPTISSSDASLMFNLSISHWYSCCIYVAAQLGIADELEHGGKTAAELAEKVNCDAGALYRVLRALAGIHVFKEDETGVFELTPLAATLRTHAPDSMRAWILTVIGHRLPLWTQLLHSVKTGRTAFSEVYGEPVWEYYKHHKTDGHNFIKAMENLTAPVIQKIVTVYDFSPFHTIVDVGGGNGTLILNILEAYPHCTGVVFDEPYVVKVTAEKVEKSGLAARCTLAGGSFFESVPAGADAYILKNILHDWNDEDTVRILKVCAAAMTANSKLLVFEAIVPEGNTAHYAKINDINMLLAQGGRERTEKDYAGLAARAGLAFVNTTYIGLEACSIIELRRAV
ncbi:methyltransferase [Chitinophaga sp. Mgbs1]|uniref:Methyltransferase n=1 Tax=Chitinophaga solisilvae TaxID=1233460 RepID=A0A9Q5GV98_9BACT|nr:methyltransferase [Chitinophaga solisilvae]